MSHLQELDHLRIPFDDIKSATNNFSHQNFLGQGGFGRVYKGQLPSTDSSEPGTTVAVKRLDVKLGGQGEHEFLTEILMLASYKHDNLVSLIGFSEDSNEKVLVYKYEVNGSLDKHLASIDLTWAQRLRICLGAAQGLEYLHEGVGAGHRVLHRDIKSSNVLLDAYWEAKISDFGLSKIGPTNQPFTFLVTNACGTFGYLDPLYLATGVLTKESDVYSFGVVLFEVLCGRPAMIVKHEDERRFLSHLVKLHQEKGTLHQIIIPNLLEQMKPYSLEVFSNIAFQCLNEDRKQRPTMGLVVKELEKALEHQLDTRSTASDPRIRTRTRLWGSVIGGWPFLFELESNQKLRKITIGHDRWIHSLMFTVEDSDGLLHSSEQYGGLNDANNKGVEISKILFEADEEIIGIAGTVGRRYGLELITTLSFVTNKRTYGPFGEKDYIRPRKKAQFSSSWDLGSFHGFYGRCGWYVEALGCYLKTNI
ncbi:probable serine/threonine-protein kinase PBL28 isoform X1 [Helianthus annuus]|uniref:Putative jacalin-like lectin domain-containing protein n=1 Tax=Helianthus annuus TaxID=4232 RepID=A0A251SLH0_HELAN|nr:probable serine/threonine-protein kinase PBL28 isoform X1 [Helianthus annuus]